METTTKTIELTDLKPVYIKHANLTYYVNEEGNVFSLFRDKLHKLTINHRKDGYSFICVQDNRTSGKNAKRMTIMIHRMVLAGFLRDGDYHFENECNHINHNGHDNRLENLEIVTHRENQLHRKMCDEKYTGVQESRSGNFYARYMGKRFGTFKTKEAAAQAIKNYIVENNISLPKYFKTI